MQSNQTHALYHFTFSSRSLMVRYAYAVRGPALDSRDEMILEERLIDLKAPHFDQISEPYLCEINPLGEVPVLVPKTDGSVLPDSRKITFRIAEQYPRLLPERFDGEVRALLDELHAIDYFALTFTGKYGAPGTAIARLLERRNGDGVSEEYRRALDGKIELIVRKEIPALKRESAEYAVLQTRELLGKVNEMLKASTTGARSGWVFGTEHPTAFDAHLVVFAARIRDAGRGELIPSRVMEYLEMAIEGDEWKEMMQGRKTVPEGGF